jgi:hypothetical protein
MTPETTALVQQLEEISVWSLDRCCMDVRILRSTAATAAKALSQERTCSTCVSLGSDAGAAICTRADVPVGEMTGRVADTWGCRGHRKGKDSANDGEEGG